VEREPPQRLFFAFWPPPAVQTAMARCRDTMLSHVHRARPIPNENLHLTLAFLGATDTPTLECYEAAANRVAILPGVSLSFDIAGFWRRSGVVWVGCETVPATLIALHRSLVEELVECGYRAEVRPFAAHVTVARNVRRVTQPMPKPSFDWHIDEICLVKSVTYADGARYDVLRRWPLAGSSQAEKG